MSSYGWGDLKARGICSSTKVRNRANPSAGKPRSREARNEVSFTSPCATSSWFHPGLILSLVVSFLRTKSKWFCFTKQVRKQIPGLWVAWPLPTELSSIWCLPQNPHNLLLPPTGLVPQQEWISSLVLPLISSPSNPILQFRTQQIFTGSLLVEY